MERLNAEEISFIEKYLNKAEHLFDVEMKSFIEKTLMKVIVEELDPSRAMLTNYGPASMNFMKLNNGIIFGFRYNQFDQKSNQSNDEWQNLYLERLNDIYHNIGYFKIELIDEEKPIPYGVIEYDEFSVIKRKSINKKEI